MKIYFQTHFFVAYLTDGVIANGNNRSMLSTRLPRVHVGLNVKRLPPCPGMVRPPCCITFVSTCTGFFLRGSLHEKSCKTIVDFLRTEQKKMAHFHG